LIVHVGQAPVGDVAQPLRERLVTVAELRDLRHARPRPCIEEYRQNHVFLERHDPDLR
jgi:hypothetical protein